jgi:hypothetical protein
MSPCDKHWMAHHLNHSNPAFEKDGAAWRAIEARGFRVVEEGEEIGL